MLVRLARSLAVCAFFAFAGASVARAEVPTGGIYVTTLPAGAEVWVDGTYAGRSPVFIDGLPAGRHSLTLTKTGWMVREIEFEIGAGQISMSSTRLDPGARATSDKTRGLLLLRGVPRGAKIAIDGLVYAGDAQRPIELSSGAHRVTIEIVRAKTTRAFNILPETTTEVIVVPRHNGEGAGASLRLRRIVSGR